MRRAAVLSSLLAVVAGAVTLAPALPVAAVAPPEHSCKVRVHIPRLDVQSRLKYHVGVPDDATGTRIQDRGILASPQSRRLGTAAAGERGNFVVTGHRNTAGGVLRDLPDLRPGDKVTVTVRCSPVAWRMNVDYTYTVTSRARYVDYFSAAERKASQAPVPFRPSKRATKAFLTLVTCATQEDHARGDYRFDAQGNPPGRWVVVAELDGR